ncbi:hypothetical protein QC589_01405 [Halomonas elongata]|uniref:DUF4376 domain-containing protein n=1 Tax=Halomonas elongata TaxID=2746 RepID=UPI00334ED979
MTIDWNQRISAAARKEKRQAQLLRGLAQQRKAAEAEGVTINGVRYAGDPGNRQALQEAMDLAHEQGLTRFESWKSSDEVFIDDHPVADVHAALLAIAARRSALIALEGRYAQDVVSGVFTDLDNLSWDASPHY